GEGRGGGDCGGGKGGGRRPSDAVLADYRRVQIPSSDLGRHYGSVPGIGFFSGKSQYGNGGLLRDLRFSGWLDGGNFIESVTGVDATLDFRRVGSSHAHRVERDF